MFSQWEEALRDLVTGKFAALVVIGPVGAGKTKTAAAVARLLEGRGHVVGGVVSPRVSRGGATVAYRVRNLMSGEERILCSLVPPGIKFRRFYFSPEGLEFACRALLQAAREAEIAVVDEVGPLELQGHGFATGIRAVRESRKPIVITVRPRLVEDVLAWLGLAGGSRLIELQPEE